MKYPKALEGLPIEHLMPGKYAVAGPGAVLHTLLGSCVSACLWDPVAGIAGMNHFLLAAPRYPAQIPLVISDAGRYGISAMEVLINDMLKRGALKSRLRAKAFGGASVMETPTPGFFQVHEVNQRFIREFFDTEQIPLLVQDLGGHKGRIIYFDTRTYDVYLRYVDTSRSRQVEQEEMEYWSHRHGTVQSGAVVLFDN